MPVIASPFRMQPFLFGMRPAKDTVDTAVKFPDIIKGTAKDAPGLLIIAPDEEILSLFYDMCKVVVGCIPHIPKINCSRFFWTSGIHHTAESLVFVALSARLDDKVSKPPVKDGIKGIDMDLVKSACRFSIGFKKGIWILWVPVYIKCRAVTGNELIFPMIKILTEFFIESKEEIAQGIFPELFSLLVKSRTL